MVTKKQVSVDRKAEVVMPLCLAGSVGKPRAGHCASYIMSSQKAVWDID